MSTPDHFGIRYGDDQKTYTTFGKNNVCSRSFTGGKIHLIFIGHLVKVSRGELIFIHSWDGVV